MELSKWTIFSLLDPKFLANLRLVCVFGNLGSEVLVITKDDDVFSMGCNSSGCLGLGDTYSTLEPRKVETLCKKNIKGFAYGSGLHVLAFNDEGVLFSWGYNAYSQLGNGTSNQSCVPTPISGVIASKKVVAVACGNHHSVALTDEGEVYAWGQNNSGQVGIGSTSNQGVPRKVTGHLNNQRVVRIACGQLSTMALLDNGELYGWGYNGNGELGIGNNSNQCNPTRVSGLNKVFVTQVACGFAHCLALTDQGELYAWGANSYGQLGTGNKAHHVSPVRLDPSIGRIVEIAASHFSHVSAAMNQSGRVYMWGHCRGHSIQKPYRTMLGSLDDVFATFSNPSSTWRCLTIEDKNFCNVQESFRLAFNDQATSDLKIRVDGQTIWVHKAVLKIRCQHYRSMFQDHWVESDKNELEETQYSYPVCHAFLKYLYTDELDVPPEEAIGLLDLANAYCETELKARCQRLLKQNLSVDNAAVLYATALRYEAQDLEEFCLKFTIHHMTAVVQSESFAALDENSVKHMIAAAANLGAFRY